MRLVGARKQLPDGATVTINGSTGEICLLDEATTESPSKAAGDLSVPSTRG